MLVGKRGFFSSLMTLQQYMCTESSNPVYGDEKEMKDSTCTAQPARRGGGLSARSISLCAHTPMHSEVLEPDQTRMLPLHDWRRAYGARCQANPLDSKSLCRSAASTPHWRPSMRPLLNLTGSFQQLGRWQRLVAVFHDCAARTGAFGRP